MEKVFQICLWPNVNQWFSSRRNKAITTVFKEDWSLFFYLSKSLESRYPSVGVRSFFKELQVDVGLMNVKITRQSA